MGETKFDIDEQEFISYLNSNTDEKRIENYLDSTLQNTTIEVLKNSKQVYFKFSIQSNSPTQQELDWMMKKIDELQLKLVKLTRLVPYLEANKLAYSFIPAYRQELTTEFGQCPVDSPQVGYEVYDPKTIDGLINLVDKIILPTPSLEELEKSNFKFPEQKRFDQSKCLSVVGIVVAILLSLAGISYNIFESKQSNIQTSQHLKSFINNIEKINESSAAIQTVLKKNKEILENQEEIQRKLSEELQTKHLPELKKSNKDY